MTSRSHVWTYVRLALLGLGPPAGYLAYVSGPLPRQTALANTVDAVVLGACVSGIGAVALLTRHGVLKPPGLATRRQVLLRALATVVVTGLFSFTFGPLHDVWAHVPVPLGIGAGIVV